MKNLNSILKGLFLAFGLSLISLNSNSQDIKLTKQEQKEARKAQLYANFKAIDTLLMKKTFVLEADYLENQY